MHSFLPAYLGGTFLSLLGVSERNLFSGGGGGGEGMCTCIQCTHPAYAPEISCGP